MPILPVGERAKHASPNTTQTLESPSLKPQPLSLFAAHLLLPLLWNDDEMKWWLMKQMLGLVFLWNFFILYGVLKLNCYMSKKCRKSFLGASRPWAREACGPRPCGWKFGSRPSSAQKTKCTSPVTTPRALPFFPGNIPDGWILERIMYSWIGKLQFQMVVVMGFGCVLCCICCSNLMIYCQLSVALNLMFTAVCSLWETGGTQKKNQHCVP